MSSSMDSSMNNKLYALTGLFDTPDEIMHAAETASKKYRKYDVHTPFPVHGMDDAMGLGESPIGWVTIIIGSTCMLLMLAFIAWVSLVDYPTVWAGKPYFNLPGYIPILFEVMVLTGAVSTVTIMFTVACGLPNNSHPLHDTPYMQRTSDDKFGLCLEAEDEAFDETSARELLTSLGAQKIEPVYFDAEEAKSGLSLLNPWFLGFGSVVAMSVSAAIYVGFNYLVFEKPMNWMSVQPKLADQDASSIFADGRSMQKPVEGTISRGYIPEPFEKDPEAMAKYVINPLPMTQDVFELGKDKYESSCSACHGNYANGDSRLPSDAYPAGPSLHSPKVADWKDGHIYHVITYGQNVMPAYAKQLTKDERWAVIHYIRALQRSQNPKETDLK